MSRKSKIDAVKKVEIVEKYLNRELSQKGAAKMCGVNKRSVQDWIRIYKTDGPESLKELILQGVHACCSGEGSLDEICVRFGIRQHPQLSSWIKAYNEGKELKELTGGSAMKKARKTTLKERICIVKDCLDHDRNYGSMALKYDCSYQQIRNWVDRYEKMGSAGLEDRRGRRIGSKPSRTPEEELRDRIAELERKNKDLQMENDLLKKVRELERRDRFL